MSVLYQSQGSCLEKRKQNSSLGYLDFIRHIFKKIISACSPCSPKSFILVKLIYIGSNVVAIKIL